MKRKYYRFTPEYMKRLELLRVNYITWSRDRITLTSDIIRASKICRRILINLRRKTSKGALNGLYSR